MSKSYNLEVLLNLGFNKKEATVAIEQAKGQLDRALDILAEFEFSFFFFFRVFATLNLVITSQFPDRKDLKKAIDNSLKDPSSNPKEPKGIPLPAFQVKALRQDGIPVGLQNIGNSKLSVGHTTQT